MTGKKKYDPIVVALNAISTASQVGTTVLSFKDAGDFMTLWSWVANLPVYKISRIVVVDNGLPIEESDSALSWRQFIAVRTWAIVFSLACLEKGIAIPSIHILQVRRPDANDDELKKLTETIPTIHFGSVFPFPATQSKNSLEDFIKQLTQVPQPQEPPSRIDCDDVRERLWRVLRNSLSLSTPNDIVDQHDISNQVGSMIMRAALPATATPWVDGRPRASAAQVMLNRLLSPPSISSPSIGADGVSSAPSWPDLRATIESKKLSLLLVDDRFADGYQKVISDALGSEVEGKSGVLRVDDAAIPPATLSLDGHTTSKSTNTLLDLKNFGENIYSQVSQYDILFLDLRLWQGEDQKNRALQRYKDLAKQLLDTSNSNKGLGGSMVVQLQRAIDATDVARDSHRSLAMLPLMIAALDPALPIILFSSTQHRSVVHAVRDCINVITDFSKPFVGSEDSDAADPRVIIESLKIAVTTALSQQNARAVWKKAVEEWKNINRPIKWHRDWPPVDRTTVPDLNPFQWLRHNWLPLAQREQYALAESLPWSYLNSILGETRIGILDKMQVDGGDSTSKWAKTRSYMNTMKIAHRNFQSINNDDKMPAAHALVSLLSLWTSGE